MSDWKPGDVAMVRLDAETEVRTIRTGDAGWRGVRGAFYDPSLPARRLVLIDPENREQVERLFRSFWDRDTDDPILEDFQAALREFANPKPVPCGLKIEITYPNGKGCTYSCDRELGHEESHGNDRVQFSWTGVTP